MYKKFLIKLDNNPQCLLTVLISGQLLLDISELLEMKKNSKDIFSSLCECIKQLYVESAERLEGNGHMYMQTSSFYIMQCIASADYKEAQSEINNQLPLAEANTVSEESGDTHAHGGHSINIEESGFIVL